MKIIETLERIEQRQKAMIDLLEQSYRNTVKEEVVK